MKIGDYEVKVTSKDTVEVGCVKVTREQIKQVWAMMEEWQPAPQFKVGDFVKVISGSDSVQGERIGEFGKIVSTKGKVSEGGEFGVEFMRKAIYSHSCSGATKHGHGAWFRAEMLELVD